jgi:hypothetical protein
MGGPVNMAAASIQRMPLREGKLRLESLIKRGKELAANSPIKPYYYDGWYAGCERVLRMLHISPPILRAFGEKEPFDGQSPRLMLSVFYRFAIDKRIEILGQVLRQVNEELTIGEALSLSVPASFWSELHLDVVKISQKRFQDGHFAECRRGHS